MALTVWNDKTVSGQYAGLVAANWKGQTYIRSAPSKVNNNSPKQQEHKRRYKKAYSVITQLYNIFIRQHYHFDKMTPANAVIKSIDKSYWDYNNQGNSEPWFSSFNFPSGKLNAYITGIARLQGDAPNYIWQLRRIQIIGSDATKCNKIFIFAAGAFDELISFDTMETDQIFKDFEWYPYNRGAWTGFIIPYNDTEAGIPVAIRDIQIF